MILRGHLKAQKRERARAYELATLIGLATHNPKKLPSFETFTGIKKQVRDDPEGLRAYLLALSKRGK